MASHSQVRWRFLRGHAKLLTGEWLAIYLPVGKMGPLPEQVAGALQQIEGSSSSMDDEFLDVLGCPGRPWSNKLVGDTQPWKMNRLEPSRDPLGAQIHWAKSKVSGAHGGNGPMGFPGEDSRSNVWPQVAVKVATQVAKTCWKPQPLKIWWKSFKENPWPKFVFFQLRF